MRGRSFCTSVLLGVLLIGLLLVLAYCTVGGSLLSPYTILLYLGWWIATLPRQK